MGLASIRSFSVARAAIAVIALMAHVGAATAANVTYEVDPASGRLLKATYPDGSYITYGYDANGNRTSAVVTQAVDTTPPGAPGTPSFSAITATSATATWSAATDNVAVTGYEWSRNGGSTWNSVGSALSASITGLTGSTSYTILVRARDAAGNAGPTSSNSFSTSDITAPSAPGTPSFSNITATSATATWTAATDNVGVTAYEWSRNGGSTWTSVGTALSANITGLTGSTSYTIRVRARDAANNAGTFSEASFSTSDVTPPGAPGAPAFSNITSSSATATWTAASDNVGVTAYEWSRNGGSTWTSVGTALSASITGLTGSTSYTVQVRARDAANNVGTTSSNSFTTQAAADTQAPSTPGAPAFSSITATSATATWAASTDNVGVTAYEVSLNGGAWTSNGTAVTRSLTGLASGVQHTLQVRARDAANNTSNVSSSSFTTLDNVAPGTPGAASFSSITATSATATWTAATDNVGVTAYEVSLNGGTWTSNGSSLSRSLTGLTSGVTYTLQVRARDAAGNTGSASSNSFSTLDNVAPGTPGAASFSSITATSAMATWTAATDNVGVTAYEVSLNGGAWTSNGSSLSRSLTGLTSGVSNTLQVRARDAAGNTGGASSSSFTTLDNVAPGTPGTPGFSSVTATSVVASWAASTDNVGVTAYEYSWNGGAWTSNGTATSRTFSGLTSGSSYSLQVRARDAAGNTSGVSSNSVTTLDNVAPTTPGTPGFSSVTATSATASWAASSDNVGVTAYEYSWNGGAWTSNGTATSRTFGSLTSGASYSLQVRARDAAGNTSGTSSGSVTTLDNVPPSAPGTPTFSSVTGSSATASWSAASDNVGVTGYQWRRTGGSWTAGGSPASLTGLSPNTTYTFEVQARDAAGNWGPVSSASFTTPVAISIFNRTVNTTGSPFTVTAFYRLRSTGDIVISSAVQGSTTDIGDWISPKSGMGNFQARASGNCNGPPVWMPLSADVTWQILAGGNPHASATCTMTVEISAIANPSVILGSAVVTLNASF